mmetsp:Transcript_72935/g.207830  ORF Transcript_72935/g.207830 Transcript_72935/m.207830 type:complete len:239 (+) Transcript_72935:539-1255(+)
MVSSCDPSCCTVSRLVMEVTDVNDASSAIPPPPLIPPPPPPPYAPSIKVGSTKTLPRATASVPVISSTPPPRPPPPPPPPSPTPSPSICSTPRGGRPLPSPPLSNSRSACWSEASQEPTDFRIRISCNGLMRVPSAPMEMREPVEPRSVSSTSRWIERFKVSIDVCWQVRCLHSVSGGGGCWGCWRFMVLVGEETTCRDSWRLTRRIRLALSSSLACLSTDSRCSLRMAWMSTDDMSR